MARGARTAAYTPSALPVPERQEAAPALAGASTVVANSWWVQHADASEGPPIALPRAGNEATALVDGEETMAAIAESMKAAKKSIWITDWMITPDLALTRDGTGKGETLSSILKAAAKRGVHVRVLLYDSVDMVASLNLRDIQAEMALERIRGIRVVRHRPGLLWSHHQKTVIVDCEVAFLGGIDLCAGRWDRPSHELKPVSGAAPFDAYNPCSPDISGPRMPWHDVHLRIRGPAVHDVAMNFLQRWKHHSFASGEAALHHSLGPDDAVSKLPRGAPTQAKAGGQWVQIVRSISAAAGGGERTELSIYEAYLRAIQNAQHCIYIENQFFVSKCEMNGDIVQNDIAGAIARRILRAIDEDAPFRVVIVIPAHPEGPVGGGTTLEVLRLQMTTIWWLRETLAKRLGDKGKPEDYVSFFYLRAAADLPNGPATEQIYVHTKLMIVDDNVVIVGSANINDRSMLGNRDSEIAAIVVDGAACAAPIAGKPRQVRTFARDLRRRLWKEHFGKDLDDPVESYPELLALGKASAAVYEAAFPGILSDRHATMADQQLVAAKRLRYGASGAASAPHAVAYPLRWLRDEWPKGEKNQGYFKDIYASAESETELA